MKAAFFLSCLIAGAGLVAPSCKKSSTPSVDPYAAYVPFSNPQPVRIDGYTDDAMEPYISADGNTLFFNNSNSSPNTDLHFATRLGPAHFQYRGKLKGVNTAALEGVPSLDSCGRFSFISNRSYNQTLRTLYVGTLVDDSVQRVVPVAGPLQVARVGNVIMDAELSRNCQQLYYSKAIFNGGSTPTASTLALAVRLNDTTFTPATGQDVLQAVNTSGLVYAASTSPNGLELYYTQAAPGAAPQLYYSLRASTADAFASPRLLTAASGFVEAPCLSADGHTLYYHLQTPAGFRLYLLTR